MYRRKIFEKFSDIYVFDFTGIGKRKDNNDINNIEIQNVVKKNLGDNQINTMYEIISSHLYKIINDKKLNNISILGRSAGGGLALELVFTHNLNVVGLNLACIGTNIPIMEKKINQYSNKNLFIRMCWSYEDTKASERIGRELTEIFINNNFKNYIYLLTTTGDDTDDKKLIEYNQF